MQVSLSVDGTFFMIFGLKFMGLLIHTQVYLQVYIVYYFYNNEHEEMKYTMEHLQKVTVRISFMLYSLYLELRPQ